MTDLKDIQETLLAALPRVKRYLVPLFGLLVAGIYGFIVFRIQSLNGAEPSSSQVAAQSQTAQVPRIDPKVLAQLQNLQDNSDNVKTLFDQTRNNPFQE